MPDLDPNTNVAYDVHGSFMSADDGKLRGIGATAIDKLPCGEIPDGGALSLRYDPARGTMHARVNGGAEVLCFTDLRTDLVPAACFIDQGDSCVVEVC